MTAAPSGLAAVVARFGDPRAYLRTDGTLSPGWESKYIIRVPLPHPTPLAWSPETLVSRVAVHRDIADLTRETFAAIDDAGLWAKLGPYGGGYAPRMKRGAASPSLHSWGIAFDWSPSRYPLGSTRRFPAAVVDVWRSFGWIYGGDFRGRKDPMHWQFARGV